MISSSRAEHRTEVHPPRYETRDLPQGIATPTFKFGIFDTFTQEFCVGGGHFRSKSAADSAVRTHNNAYERGQRDSDDEEVGSA